ncbi:MAG TPA: AtpZ/AtpI family protein [Ktedonobacterales bacterium]|jgi:F0F1-type ATP synthase assembly protein I
MKNPGNHNSGESKDSSIKVYAIASQVGLGIAFPPVLGGVVGWYLDSHVIHNSVPIATIIGLLLGLSAAVYGFIRLISLLS